MNSQQATRPAKVLISDFDGTMTRYDFYQLAIELLLPSDTPDYWADYRAGTITHFEALRRYFAAIRCSHEAVLAVLKKMNLDTGLSMAVERLRQEGWQVVVASAGCGWYIHQLLNEAGVSLEVHSNPGRFEPGQGLLMELPFGSPFFSDNLGVNKTGIVQQFVDEGATVAFAGDGFPDAEPARLVPENLRFARGDLAGLLNSEGLRFQRFDVWSDIARVLIERSTEHA